MLIKIPPKFKNPQATLTKRSVMFRCEECGKLTRDTMGYGNTYCAKCEEEMQEENARADGKR